MYHTKQVSGAYLPDFKEIDRYTGVMKARNFELFNRI